MNWIKIMDLADLDTIDRASVVQKAMIFKHSTRCGLSSTAKARVEREWTSENEKLLKPYFLDLITYRWVSNAIEARYGVRHESPQALIISNGKCIFSQTHLSITVAKLMEMAKGY